MEAVIGNVQPYFEEWGYLIVFLALLLENSAFLGAVIPGDVVLLLAGFYVERSSLDLAPIIVLAFSGALMGDTLGYFIGRTFGRRLVDRFGKRIFPPERQAHIDRYFQEYGIWAVTMGRFAPVIRTFNTFAAGISRMPLPAFLFAVAIAAAAWAVLVPTLGFFFGSSLELVKRALGWAGVAILLLFAGGLYWTYRRMLRRLAQQTELPSVQQVSDESGVSPDA